MVFSGSRISSGSNPAGQRLEEPGLKGELAPSDCQMDFGSEAPLAGPAGEGGASEPPRDCLEPDVVSGEPDLSCELRTDLPEAI